MYRFSRERKAILWRFIVKWQKFIVSKKTYQTPAEKIRQSSSYAALKRRLREYLKKCRLQRRSAAVWLFLHRNGRLHKHYKKDDEQNTDQNSQGSVNTEYDEQEISHDEQVRMNQQYISYPASYEQTGQCTLPVVTDNIS
jgi:hypothetical protein